jgi:hypothetical protein
VWARRHMLWPTRAVPFGFGGKEKKYVFIYNSGNDNRTANN